MAYCDRCDRYFRTLSALFQHEANSEHHNTCDDCNLDFPTFTGLKEHWVQSLQHFYCQGCSRHYHSKVDLVNHYLDDHFFCSPCNKVFKSDLGLHEHYRQSHAHHYCAGCKRLFLSESNLQSHLNSSVHRAKDVPCPFKGCSQAFVSRSALILHLESGKCSSGMDRGTINRFVRQYDTSNIITDPSRLLTNGNGHQDTKYHATAASWNGNMFECYLCHGTYRTLPALNQHLASPRHQDKIYICPLSSCRLRFTTLSALCQHIESERCGVSKFKAVQSAMDKIVGQMGRLTYH